MTYTKPTKAAKWQIFKYVTCMCAANKCVFLPIMNDQSNPMHSYVSDCVLRVGAE